MRICVVGGGHIGTTLTCYIKHTFPDYFVSLYTRRQDKFVKELICNDIEREISYRVIPDVISSDARLAADRVDMVFIALPHFAVEKAFEDIAPFVAEKALIGVLPGGGGCEFFFNKHFDSKKTLFGFQRVPFTAKLQEYGKEVNLKSWKSFSVVGTLQTDRVDFVCEQIEKCGFRIKKATNYLEIALTPTNPILHTSRTYELFRNYKKEHLFEERVKFYVGWTNEASTTLFEMDNELHNLLNVIEDLSTCAIRPLSEHYESSTIEALTNKINSIPTFQSVFAPMKEIDGKFIADTSSRMFTEDFPWGLVIIRSYFEFFGIAAPMMDKVLSWYSEYMGLEWYKDGKFVGNDLKYTGDIRNYGYKTSRELIALYKSK